MNKKPTMRAFKSEKLWRDKMPTYCEANGSIITTKTLNDQEFDRELRKKCVEEADEVQAAKDRAELVEELADLYEVIDALLALHTIRKEDVITIQDKKRNEKGGFTQRAYATIVQHPIGSYSELYCSARPDKYPEIKPPIDALADSE